MDQKNAKLQEVLKLLEADGTTPEAAVSVIEIIGQAVSAKVFATINDTLTDEDAKLVDECQTDEEADTLLRQLFASHSDRSIESLANEFTEVFATGFLEKYQKDKAAALANPVQAS